MSTQSVLIAKVAALKKAFDNIPYRGHNCLGHNIEYLFPRYISIIKDLKELNPEYYSDIPNLEIPEPSGHSPDGRIFEQDDVCPLVNTLNYILELNANVRIGESTEAKERLKRIFISHGRSKEWYKIQSYIEKDLKLPTLELAQEPHLGRTVIQKLNEESNKCCVAIIVMTGDDIISEGEVRARENVMHEIGYFQGKYGLGNVILLHEDGVNIPSNIHGLGYIAFPKDTAEASLGAITRELKVLLS